MSYRTLSVLLDHIQPFHIFTLQSRLFLALDKLEEQQCTEINKLHYMFLKLVFEFQQKCQMECVLFSEKLFQNM